ncbi:hypothetical protein HAP41_0000026665 [Bradyrhizobium barranii subsp. apii]|uniref:Uncharacterized protein n=1 Tax=Bradyrhizobium barranii subsp. apii TaxID=2819348 RepID=A0A8U0F7D0_9BRAD|nr:hypothetical protein [Bradyrhizobium barranii]UPT83982.1 hypothetical protein HAP41_0000026665 [Bradyrhizobium barranii subsp. apii]
MDIIEAIVTKSQWIIAILALFVVAWARFNSPPTNRSGTTFALFFWGVIFYYALMIPLWLVVMIGLVQGSIGFDHRRPGEGGRSKGAGATGSICSDRGRAHHRRRFAIPAGGTDRPGRARILCQIGRDSA